MADNNTLSINNDQLKEKDNNQIGSTSLDSIIKSLNNSLSIDNDLQIQSLSKSLTIDNYMQIESLNNKIQLSQLDQLLEDINISIRQNSDVLRQQLDIQTNQMNIDSIYYSPSIHLSLNEDVLRQMNNVTQQNPLSLYIGIMDQGIHLENELDQHFTKNNNRVRSTFTLMFRENNKIVNEITHDVIPINSFKFLSSDFYLINKQYNNIVEQQFDLQLYSKFKIQQDIVLSSINNYVSNMNQDTMVIDKGYLNNYFTKDQIQFDIQLSTPIDIYRYTYNRRPYITFTLTNSNNFFDDSHFYRIQVKDDKGLIKEILPTEIIYIDNYNNKVIIKVLYPSVYMYKTDLTTYDFYMIKDDPSYLYTIDELHLNNIQDIEELMKEEYYNVHDPFANYMNNNTNDKLNEFFEQSNSSYLYDDDNHQLTLNQNETYLFLEKNADDASVKLPFDVHYQNYLKPIDDKDYLTVINYILYIDDDTYVQMKYDFGSNTIQLFKSENNVITNIKYYQLVNSEQHLDIDYQIIDSNNVIINRIYDKSSNINDKLDRQIQFSSSIDLVNIKYGVSFITENVTNGNYNLEWDEYLVYNNDVQRVISNLYSSTYGIKDIKEQKEYYCVITDVNIPKMLINEDNQKNILLTVSNMLPYPYYLRQYSFNDSTVDNPINSCDRQILNKYPYQSLMPLIIDDSLKNSIVKFKLFLTINHVM